MPTKILVIDDDLETRSLIQIILSKEGYELTTARSGETGLQLAKKTRPDLVLLDVMMPDMDGFEVCRRFRNNPELAHTPIIMFTAANRPQDKAEGFAAGVNDFLSKPTTGGELIERIRMQLGQMDSTIDDELAMPDEGLMSGEDAPLPDDSSPEATNLRIGVLGVRGGVGATTIALNLATSLAKSGQETILADFDLVQGLLSGYLNQPANKGLQRIIQDEAYELDDLLTPYQNGLSLLLTPPNVGGLLPVPGRLHLTLIGQTLARDKRAVVADLGRGITSKNQLLLGHLNHLICCLSPEKTALPALRQILRTVESRFPSLATHLLMVNFFSSVEISREAVEKSLGYPLLDIVTIRPSEMSQAINRGVPLQTLFPDGRYVDQFDRMAQEFIAMTVAD
jgi:CheY-like chemotaxis protein